jgi:hypothetical protein
MQNQPALSPTISIAQIHKKAKFRLSMISYGLSCLLALNALLFVTHIWFSLPLFLAAMILFQRTIRVRKQLCAMEVNGDALIISGGQSDTITDIKSIRKIRSTRIGRQKITQVHFKLDGTERKVMLLTPREDSPGRILSELKKNKKADL